MWTDFPATRRGFLSHSAAGIGFYALAHLLRHDGLLADVGASVMRWLTGRDAPELPGTPFV